MPIREGVSNNKPYFQYGTTGKKYFYIPTSKKSKIIAYSKALRQTKAIHSRK
jgi:hypothetical protein